mgnify:CR=1 FL=1|tara:strand:- start:14680 stop:15786 length:1107 start_codon:yes stop_codon:yes gene_type:complete
MKRITYILLLITTLVSTLITAQENSADYLNKSWKEVATKMPMDWYSTQEAAGVAENILIAQKEIGGWKKNKPYHHTFSKLEKEHYVKDKSAIGATFDNDATITELRFLAKMYANKKDPRYKAAFERGLNYIFIAQYANGGWPQFFPVRTGNTSYSAHITYNDNAMVNTMKFLKEIYTNDKEFAALNLTNQYKTKAKNAFNNGINCILKTQIIVQGKPTVWCAQHDEITLAPANARSYELASFSGGESVGIVLLLMDLENPSKEIINAINGAIEWFKDHKIEGIKLDTEIQDDGRKNRIVVKDENAPTLWGRFYDLDTEKPYFSDRDGIKKNTFAEMGYDRRNGYAWYTNAPEKALEKYEEWKLKFTNN